MKKNNKIICFIMIILFIVLGVSAFIDGLVPFLNGGIVSQDVVITSAVFKERFTDSDHFTWEKYVVQYKDSAGKSGKLTVNNTNLKNGDKVKVYKRRWSLFFNNYVLNKEEIKNSWAIYFIFSFVSFYLVFLFIRILKNN